MIEPADWLSSNPVWGALPALAPGARRHPEYGRFIEHVRAVKQAAERVIVARRKDNLGGTSDEAALLVAIKDARKKTMAALKEKTTKILTFQADSTPIAPALMTWSTSRKYMGSLGSVLVHSVREFAATMTACNDHTTALLLDKARRVNTRNHYMITKALTGFRKALDELVAFGASSGLCGQGGIAPADIRALESLVAQEAREDTAVCCVTGLLIQTWAAVGEGTPRYACEDAHCKYRVKEVHEALAAVYTKIMSLPDAAGLREQCLTELKKLDPYIDSRWLWESNIPARIRICTITTARTPAELFRIAAAQFSERRFIGLPTRLQSSCVLPDSVFLTHDSFAWLTYRTTDTIASALALGLRQRVGRGGVVALVCGETMNRIEWIFAEFAAALAGLTLVPIHWSVAQNDALLTDWFLSWSVRAIICFDQDAIRFRKYTEVVTTMKTIVCISHATQADVTTMYSTRQAEECQFLSFKALCGFPDPPGTEAPPPHRNSLVGKKKEPVPPRTVKLEPPEQQPKAGPLSPFTFQLTAGSAEAPPKLVRVSCDRLLASLPYLLHSAPVTALLGPWSFATQRWQVWHYLANGGRVGLIKWITDEQAETERLAVLASEAAADPVDELLSEGEPATEGTEGSRPPTALTSLSALSVASPFSFTTRAGTAGTRVGTAGRLTTAGSKTMTMARPGTAATATTAADIALLSDGSDEFGHTDPSFPLWWEEYLCDATPLQAPVVRAPPRLFRRLHALYADRRLALTRAIEKGEAALIRLKELEEEAKNPKPARSPSPPPPQAVPARAESPDGGYSSKLALMLASVDSMVAKVEAAVHREEEAPPTPPKGRWQRHHVKPHHTAAQELRDALGPAVKECVCVCTPDGPPLGEKELEELRVALNPKVLVMSAHQEGPDGAGLPLSDTHSYS